MKSFLTHTSLPYSVSSLKCLDMTLSPQRQKAVEPTEPAQTRLCRHSYNIRELKALCVCVCVCVCVCLCVWGVLDCAVKYIKDGFGRP